ncbi:MAG: response regulator, partial [Pseudomonadota bacterium]
VITVPVLHLSEIMRRVSDEDNYSIRAYRHGEDELGKLIDGFNKMLSEIQTTNKQLRENISRAEASNQAKLKFMSTMSHEIRTPMNAIIGYSSLLQEDLRAIGQDEYLPDLESIERSSKHLIEIINDVLDFSKIDAGTLELSEEEVDVGWLLEDLADQYAQPALQKDLELCTHVPSEIPIKLRGDSKRLRQVLENLVGNAVKYTEHGEIVVRMSLVRDDPDRVLLGFEIDDTGEGMTSEQLEQLFEPFSHVDRANTLKYGSTGLGLAICKSLAEMMDGRIGAQSKQGQGSSFWFTAALKKLYPPEMSPYLRRFEGVRVLIVEHNASSREILSDYLSEWGAITNSCASSEAALQRMQDEHRYDVIVIEQGLPGTDGISFAAQITTEAGTTRTRLMLMADNEVPSRKGLEDAAFMYTLHKPIHRGKLYEALEYVMKTPLRQGGHTSTVMDEAFKDIDIIPINDEVIEKDIVSIPEENGESEVDLELPEMTVSDGFNGLNVLLAEDNPVNQKVASLMLAKMGCAVDLALNGEEAVTMTEVKKYDLIFMDCQMPEMDGFEATRLIRARTQIEASKYPYITIVALTANALEGDREKCLTAGMDDYLGKPFTKQQLESILQKWSNTQSSDDELHSVRTS